MITLSLKDLLNPEETKETTLKPISLSSLQDPEDQTISEPLDTSSISLRNGLPPLQVDADPLGGDPVIQSRRTDRVRDFALDVFLARNPLDENALEASFNNISLGDLEDDTRNVFDKARDFFDVKEPTNILSRAIVSVDDFFDSIDPKNNSNLDNIFGGAEIAVEGGLTVLDSLARGGLTVASALKAETEAGTLGNIISLATNPAALSLKFTDPRFAEDIGISENDSFSEKFTKLVFQNFTGGSPEKRAEIRNELKGIIGPEFAFQDESILKGFFFKTLPQVGAESASFALATAVNPALGAALASATGRAEFEDDALKNGASVEETRLMGAIGSVLGLSELLGISRVFGQIDDLSRLSVADLLETKVLAKTLRRGEAVGVNALVSGIEEALQEGGFNVALNFSASDVVGFDPNRSLLDGVGESTLTGGGAGFFLSLLTSAIGGRSRRAAQKVLTDNLNAFQLNAGDVGNIAGAFTAITQEDLDRLNSPALSKLFLDKAAEDLLKKGSAIDIDNFLAATKTLTKNTPQDIDISVPEFRLQLEDNFIQTFDEKGDIVETSQTILEALSENLSKETPENITLLGSLLEATVKERVQLNILQNTINTLQKELVDAGVIKSAQITSTKEKLEKAQTQIQALLDFKINVAKKSLNFVNFLNKNFLTEGHAVILDVGQANQESPVLRHGAFGSVITSPSISRVGLNLGVTLANFDLEDLDKKTQEEIEASIFGTLAHEFGHVLLSQLFFKQDLKVQQAIFEEFKNGVLGVSLSPVANFETAGQQITPTISGESPQESGTPFVRGASTPSAFLSFTEFLARRVADSSLRDTGFFPEVTKDFFSEAQVRLSEIFQELSNNVTNNAIVTRARQRALVRELPTILNRSQQKTFTRRLLQTYPILKDRVTFSSKGLRIELPSTDFAADIDLIFNPQDRTIEFAADIETIEKPSVPIVFKDLGILMEILIRSEENGGLSFTELSAFFAKDTAQGKAFRIGKDVSRILETVQFRRFPKVITAFLDSLAAPLIQQRTREALQNPKNILNSFSDIGKLKAKGFDSQSFDEGHLAELDRFSRVHRIFLDILQWANLNKHIKPLQDFVRLGGRWNALKVRFAEHAQSVHKDWRKLGKKQAALVSEVLVEQTLEGVEFTLVELLRKGLNPAAIDVVNQVDQDMKDILNRLEKAAVETAQKTLADNQVALQQRLKEITQEFNKLRSKPFFPLTRFGRHAVVVREVITTEEGIEVPGPIVSFESFDTKKEQEAVFNRTKKSPNIIVAKTLIDDVVMGFQGLPPSLVQSLMNKLNLTAEQRTQVKDFIIDLAPERSFLKHFKRRKGTPGFSLDGQRSYLNYMQSAASHMANLIWGTQMEDAIKELEKQVKEIAKTPGGDNTKRTQILNGLKAQLEYMQNPGNEWNGLRSVGFFTFLGLNLSSAFVNTTQLPMVTFPWLSNKFGEPRTLTALGKAVKQSLQYYTSAEGLDPELNQVLAQAIKDNKINQSLAVEMAAATEIDNLNQLLDSTTIGIGVSNSLRKGAKSIIHNISKYSAVPFSLIEQNNRVVTMLAAYSLARDGGMAQKEAYQFASEAVDATQFEQARWARADILKGGKGAAFLFMNFIRNGLFNLFMREGAFRTNMMLLTMGGVIGLPFADDLEEFLSFFFTQSRARLGVKDPFISLELEFKEFLDQHFENPDLIMHGLARKSFGIPQIVEASGFDFPVPEFDLSQRVGFGKIIPGSGLLTTPGNFEDKFTGAIESSGALQSKFVQIARALGDRNPDNFKRQEQLNILAVSNFLKAQRFADMGSEQTLRGDIIAEFDPMDPEDQILILGQALGFRPTKVTEGWENFIQQKNASNFYLARRSIILAQLNAARLAKDSEALAAVKKARKKYNNQVPFPELKITARDEREAFRRESRDRAKARRDIPRNQRVRRLEQAIADRFEDTGDAEE